VAEVGDVEVLGQLAYWLGPDEAVEGFDVGVRGVGATQSYNTCNCTFGASLWTPTGIARKQQHCEE
jgi:hypothetical protein